MKLSAPHRTTRLAVITTSPYQVALFMRGHLERLPDHIEPVIYTNTEDSYAGLVGDLPLRHIPIGRTPIVTRSDMLAGRKLRRELANADIRSVVTMSPKGGFVGQIAARSARVPRRLHIFTGQVWQGMDRGPLRLAVLSADRLIGHTATALAADSPSQADNLQRFHIPRRGLSVDVPHPPGSIRGVDLARFRPWPEKRREFRSTYVLDDEAVAFVHLGRITAAKGIPELAGAFSQVRAAWRKGLLPREPRLFLVGQDEGSLTSSLALQDGVHVMDFTREPEAVLAGTDVLVLASHREGFGSSVIEAAAVGLPTIGTDIVGVRDAVVPGETGWLVPRQAAPALRVTMESVLRDPAETHRRAGLGLERARRDFDAEHVTQAWVDYLTAFHEGDET